jgi:hypothetical protein
MESYKIHVPNHQPGLILGFSLQMLGMLIQAIEDCEACSDSKILALVAHENPNVNECINHPAERDCFWLLEPRSMWQAQSATAHHQTGRLRRLRLHQNPPGV